MFAHITTDHVYHVGTDTVIAIDENLLVCIDGVYCVLGDIINIITGPTAPLRSYAWRVVNADGKVDPQALVDANVAVEE